MCVREKAYEKERDFYGLFTLGRHACGGQSQLDMPERFLLESKMGVKGKRGKRKAETKKVIYRVGERERETLYIHHVFSQ